MSIELVNHLMKKTPLEEKLEVIAEGFESLVYSIVKISESFDKNLYLILDKINEVDEKINYFNKDIKITEVKPTEVKQPLPPPPNPSSINMNEKRATFVKKSVRQELIAELKDILKAREGKQE